jgi:hypothetical protein
MLPIGGILFMGLLDMPLIPSESEH